MKIEMDLNAVELGEPAFGKAPKRFDPVDVGTASGERLLFVDAHMLVVADIDQAVVSGPAVRAEDVLRVDPQSEGWPAEYSGSNR